MMPHKLDIWRPPYRLAEIPGLGDRLAFVNCDGAIVAAIRRNMLAPIVLGNAPIAKQPAMRLGQEVANA